jgi:hypothetical protein
VDERLHTWATHNDHGIDTIIAGHTHRAVFENLSLTEMRLQELRFNVENIPPLQARRDHSYYKTGSCVHPFGITGLEITFENGPEYRMINWEPATEGNRIIIRRYAVDD